MNIAPAELLNFFKFMKKMENWVFWIWAYFALPNFPNSLKSWEIGILKSPWFYILLDCEIVFQAQYDCRRKRGTNLWLNCQFSRKRNVHIFITILCHFKCCKNLKLYLEQTKLVRQRLRSDSSQYVQYDQTGFFLLTG